MDGTKVAMLGRFAVATGRPATGPFVIRLDGSGYTRLIDVASACTGCATPDAQWIQWTLDSQALYVRGDIIRLITNLVCSMFQFMTRMFCISF